MCVDLLCCTSSHTCLRWSLAAAKNEFISTFCPCKSPELVFVSGILDLKLIIIMI